VLTVALNRPEVHNALTPMMNNALTAVFQSIPEAVRVVELTGNGRSFCAGAD
jgi:enoyl-CoA hydratase/carnithine racemase